MRRDEGAAAVGVLDEEAKYELREQKMRLDREFGAMLAKIAERREKDILVGKITELYAAKGDDPPFGLASSDLATLRRHLERMRDRK